MCKISRLKKNIDVHCVVTQQGQYVIEFNEHVGQLRAEIIIKDWQEYDPNVKDVTSMSLLRPSPELISPDFKPSIKAETSSDDNFLEVLDI